MRVLTREHGRVLALIDGKSSLSDILQKSTRPSQNRLAAILDELVEIGFIRLLSENLAVDDLGFSSTIIVSDANTQAFFDAQADVERALRRAEDHKMHAKVSEQERLLKEVKTDIETETQALLQHHEAKRSAQARAEQERKARDAAEAQARARAEEAAHKQAQAEAEARAKALEIEIHARKQAARKAQQEAEQRAEIEAQERMEAEKKKAREQAEKKAEAAARAREAAERKTHEAAEAKAQLAKEAAESAQRALEAKVLAEEEAQHRAQMEAHLREMEDAKNQAEAEAHSLANALDEARIAAELETRVKRRMEARAREEIDARERVQAEAQAKIEQAERLRAEAAARALAEEAARHQAELDAQAKLEAERKAREEAEKQARAATEARVQAEETARLRAEMAARARAEEEARLEAERKAQAEAEALARAQAEAEARRQAEEETRRQAEESARVHAEAEARAVAEAEEAIRLEAEAAKRQLEEQQRAEEARRAREVAEREAEAERQAWAAAEATAKALAEERAQREADTKSREEARRQAREEAEAQARAETEAALRRAEEEARYEEAEEARLRAEAETRAIAAAQGAQPLAFLVRRRKRTRFDKRWIKPIAMGTAALLLVALGIVHLISFNFYIPQLERQLSESLGQHVVVRDIRFAAFPAPHLELEGVTIGDTAAVRIAKAQLFPTFSSWFSDEKMMRRVALESVTLSEDSVGALPVWSRRQTQAVPINFEHLQVKDAKLAHRVFDLFAFDADMDMHRGRFVKAQMRSSDRHITLDFLPQGDALRIDLSAVHAVLPLGPQLQFDTLKLSALARGGNVITSDIEGQLYGGSLTGTAKMEWGKGWTFNADLGLRHVALDPSLPFFTRDVKIDGTLDAKVRLTAQAASLQALFAAPQVQATFHAKNGEFSGIDLARALQAPSHSGNVGGKTYFNELSGDLQLAKGRYQYRQIKLQGGAINATGYLAISPERALSGNLLGELHTRVTTIRTPFTFGGTPDSPTLKATVAPQLAPAPAVEPESPQ